MIAPTALQQALRLRDQPERLTDLQRAPLPPDMGGLIRIASGDAAATDDEQSAAAAFLEQVCLHADADARRCLALQAHDDLITARSHHRLLIKWLHPDRNPGAQVLAERVNSAWTALKTPAPMAPIEASAWPAAPVPRSRFPLFLGVLLVAALALLAISLVPEAPVYVDVAEQPAAPAVAEPISTQALPTVQDRRAIATTEANPSGVASVKPMKAPIARKVEKIPMPIAPKSEKNPPTPAKAVVVKTPPPAPTLPRLPVSTPVVSPIAETISAAEAENLLQQYQAHYSAGNLSGLMALFSPKAISLKGGVDAIAADYSRLFTGTRQRRIALSNPRWEAVDEARRLRAGFQTEMAFAAGRSPQRRSGSLEMLLVRENGKPRILELLITE